MTLNEVERLLGAPGVEIGQSRLPSIVDSSLPLGDPRHVRIAVSGERYFRWEGDYQAELIVSLKDGAVAEKYFWEPSL